MGVSSSSKDFSSYCTWMRWVAIAEESQDLLAFVPEGRKHQGWSKMSCCLPLTTTHSLYMH